MKILAYLDCPSGIAGDMCLAALIDAGVPLEYLQTQLATLGLSNEFTLTVTPTHRQGLRALHAEVTLTPPAQDHRPGHAHHHHLPATAEHDQGAAAIAATATTRNLPAIEQLINQATLPNRAQRWSLAVFRRLAEAEAAVHGIAVDQVHFHEVGATDAIVDIVGTCLGLDYLGVEQLFCSPVPTGRGRVRAAHGWLPVPAPAVLKLLEQRQVPIYSNGLDGELVTPTGAAIVTALAESFGDPPTMTLRCTGLGAGGKELPIANVLRLWIGEAASLAPAAAVVQSAPAGVPYDSDTVTLLETQVDDLLPQAIGYLHDRLLAAGALDLFTQPAAMKKSRPGLLITVLCRPEDELHCTDILFTETSTLGIRRQTQQRWVLPRHTETLDTPYGSVALKLAYHPRTQAVLNVHPEYEDCAALARHHNIPWQTVHQTALSLWYQQANKAF